MWNIRELPQPPNISFKCFKQDLDLVKFKNALQDGVNHLINLQLLKNEAATLSRILYRMKMKFRSAKEFKLLEKLNRLLEIYFTVTAKLCRHMKNIIHMTPSKYHQDTYLPTKNMLYYALVLLQGLAELMKNIHDHSLAGLLEINKRLSIGHFWKLFLILFALLSRISIIIKFNTKLICEFYGKLYVHTQKLDNTGESWLQEQYILPTDLRSWLSVPWVYEEEFVDLTFEPANDITKIFELIDDDDDDVLFCDEFILLDDEENKQKEKDWHGNRMRGFSISEEDIGEEILDFTELKEPVIDLVNYKNSSKRSLNKSHEASVEYEICLSDDEEVIKIKENNDVIAIDDTVGNGHILKKKMKKKNKKLKRLIDNNQQFKKKKQKKVKKVKKISVAGKKNKISKKTKVLT